MGKVKNLIWDKIEFETAEMTLDEYRTAAGLSHNAMARELEISINTWRKWVNDPNPPRWLVLATAAIYHRVP